MSSQSTVTLQDIVDVLQTFPDLEPVLGVVGSSAYPMLKIANDVMDAICSLPFPQKWNEFNLPVFYTSSQQQDYAGIYPDGTSVLRLSWLERGIAFNINSSALPKEFRQVECGRQLPQATATVYNSGTGGSSFVCNFFPNNILYYGTWGDPGVGTGSLGNNPVQGSLYIDPLGAGSMPLNPITQIQDANGNYLVLTTYGQEGTTAPLAAANAPAGTTASGMGATTIWTVVDPYGQGFRILPVPSQTGLVWQISLTGQMKSVRFTNLSQTLFPLPDEYERNFTDGCIAQCYRYSPEAKVRAKFKEEWQMYMMSLKDLRQEQDRELEENVFGLERGIMGGARGRNKFLGPQWPFNNPQY